MDTKTFFEWLDTCPSNEWFITDTDEGIIRVLFCVDDPEELQEEQELALQDSLNYVRKN